MRHDSCLVNMLEVHEIYRTYIEGIQADKPVGYHKYVVE
jgi:hypothetical protein